MRTQSYNDPDLLWGIKSIAAHINKPTRKTHYLLERRLIPAAKVGNQWVSSKRRLDEHFAELIESVA